MLRALVRFGARERLEFLDLDRQLAVRRGLPVRPKPRLLL